MRKVEKSLRERIKKLETELAEVKADRNIFRERLANNLKTAIRLHGEVKYWSMPNLIETFAKDMQAVKWWYW